MFNTSDSAKKIYAYTNRITLHLQKEKFFKNLLMIKGKFRQI